MFVVDPGILFQMFPFLLFNLPGVLFSQLVQFIHFFGQLLGLVAQVLKIFLDLFLRAGLARKHIAKQGQHTLIDGKFLVIEFEFCRTGSKIEQGYQNG